MHRTGTSDHAIWKNIVDNNDYRLPDDMSGWVVIDIGAHTGAFTYACIIRNAAAVYAIEPDIANFRALHKNVESERTRVTSIRTAIANDTEGYLFLSDYPKLSSGEINTGGANLFTPGEQQVPTYPLNYIIDHVTQREQQANIDMIKFDCEGSEWESILLTPSIFKIDRIAGEFHEYGPGFEYEPLRPYRITELEVYLKDLGYEFEYFRNEGQPNLGMFFAKRKGF